jgi:hypothetical protein
MQKLKLPEYGFRMREKNKQILIFDEFRHRWVVLTPEEWVRQHYLKFLVTEKRFPKQLLAVEKKVMVNGLPQRFDLMVCDRKGNPLLVAEFKSPSVEITQPVFDQAGRYNGILRAPYLLVSNGLHQYFCRIDFKTHRTEYLPEIPDYEHLNRT